MFKVVKKGDTYKLMYSAKNFTTGLADVQAIPYNPSGVAQTAISMSEIATSGVYWADFDTTGKTLGVWGFKINSASKSAPAGERIQIVDGDTLNDTMFEKIDTMLDSVLADVQSGTFGLQKIHDDIVIIDGNVDDIETIVSDVSHGNAALKTAIDSLSNQVGGLSNNADAKVALQDVFLIPDTGTNTYKFWFRFYDSAGNMEDPDDQDAGAGTAMVNVSVANSAGADRSGNLGGLDASTQDSKDWMTRESIGVFTATYAVANTHAVEDLVFSFDLLEGALAKSFGAITRVVSSAEDYTSRFNTIDSNLAIVDTVVDGIQSDLDNSTDGLGALKTLIDAIQTDLDNGTDGLGAIKTAVDGNNTLLSDATYGLSALKTLLDTIDTNTSGVSGDMTAIKGSGWVADDNLHNIAADVAPGGIAI